MADAGSTQVIPVGGLAQLNGLASTDVDGDALSYSVLHGTSRLGAPVQMDGAVATYTPPAGSASVTDELVYVVTDGRGGVGAGVVTVALSK